MVKSQFRSRECTKNRYLRPLLSPEQIFAPFFIPSFLVFSFSFFSEQQTPPQDSHSRRIPQDNTSQQTTTIMAIFLLAIGVKRFVERQMAKKHRSPLEYVALTSLALLVAAIAKYPNRAIFTRARPDLKEITADGHPLFGNMLQALTSKENPLIVLHKAFQKRGDIYVITVPYRGRFFMVNHPMYIEYILKSKSLIIFFRLLFLVERCFPPCGSIVFFGILF